MDHQPISDAVEQISAAIIVGISKSSLQRRSGGIKGPAGGGIVDAGMLPATGRGQPLAIRREDDPLDVIVLVGWAGARKSAQEGAARRIKQIYGAAASRAFVKKIRRSSGCHHPAVRRKRDGVDPSLRPINGARGAQGAQELAS